MFGRLPKPHHRPPYDLASTKDMRRNSHELSQATRVELWRRSKSDADSCAAKVRRDADRHRCPCVSKKAVW